VKLVIARATKRPRSQSIKTAYLKHFEAFWTILEPLEFRHWAVCIGDNELWELYKKDVHDDRTRVEGPKKWEEEKPRFSHEFGIGWTNLSPVHIQGIGEKPSLACATNIY
jgi:hypothetical protein